MKKDKPAMYNIFQGNDLIRATIAKSLGYPPPDNGWFTQDIYFQAYFYLSKRFGPAIIEDEYKDGGVWKFEVKKYIIVIQLNSSWVEVMMYGPGSKDNFLSRHNFRNYSMRTPYYVRRMRECVRKKDQLVDIWLNWSIWSKNSDQRALRQKVFTEFCQKEEIDDSWTQERFQKEKAMAWVDYAENYNMAVINVSQKEYRDKYGDDYSNAQTRHALRTLTQFLHNMLSPIWVRDCAFNIKGRCGNEYDHFKDNIEIKFVKPND